MNIKNTTSFRNKTVLLEGLHDGVPIGMGYLAVSFSLGIAAKNAGLSPFQGFLASALCNASAGEYAGFVTIASLASFAEIALITLIANARYLLMSCAMSQRIHSDTSIFHRIMMGFYLTDELFGIAIARPGYLNPFYTYGAVIVAGPCWAVGTALGTMAGNMLPLNITSALSVSLYGMFLAIIIPPSRKNKVIAGIVIVSFAASYAATHLPAISTFSDGTKTIILTLVISVIAAILFPVNTRKEETNNFHTSIESSGGNS